MPDLRIYLLGVPRIELNGDVVETNRNKAIAMLAYLAVNKGMHRRESLATMLWPENDQSRSFANLRRTLWELNNILGEGWITPERETIGMAGGRDYWLDVDQFERLTDGCSQHMHAENELCPECIQSYKEAAELYRGDFLTGFNLRDSPEFDNWQFFQSEGLRHKMAVILESLVSCSLAAGDPLTAAEYSRRWLSMDFLNEGAHRQLMLSYARAGKRAAALRQYQECVRVLADELNVEPEAETVELYEKIRDSMIDRTPAHEEQPGIPAPPARSLKLPTLPAPFIGREEDLAKVLLLLQDEQCRLLTLVGLGGIGKTRLAVEAGERIYKHLGERFANGIYLISLAPLSTPDSLVPAIADALDYSFQEEDSPRLRLESQHNQLLDFLREKEALLILDNFEHLVEGAGLLSEIVAATAGVKLLVTSRERLNLPEEWTYEVHGMDYPEAGSQAALGDYSAVKLFLQSAERVRAGEWMPLEEMSHIARICRLLQGVPLALELAAAWTKSLSPSEIAREIEQSLDFLVTPLRGVVERHHSLRAVFDHSWKLLHEEEQKVFSRLSIFRGAFTREAAAQVAGASLPILTSLIDKSLVRRAGVGKYEMHELVKQYAAEKLAGLVDEEERTRHQHGRYYAQQLTQIEISLKGADQVDGLNQIEHVLEDIRAAWHWSAARKELNVFYSIGFSLYLFLTIRNRFQEGIDLTSRIIQQLRASAGGKPSSALLQALAFGLGVQRFFLNALERYEEMRATARECLSIMEEVGSLTGAENGQSSSPYLLYLPALIIFGAWDLERGVVEELYQNAVTGFQNAGDVWGEALTKAQYAQVMRFRFSDFGRTKELFEESYNLFRRCSNAWGAALSLTGLANTSLMEGNYDAVIHYALESQEIYDEMGDKWHMIDNYFKLGMASMSLGAYSTAREYYTAALELIRDLGSRFILSSIFDSIGYVDYLLENYDAAEAAYRESLEISVSLGDLHNQGMALQNMGDVLRARGDWEAAGEHYHRAIELLGEDSIFWEQAMVWKKRGIVYRETGDHAKARESLITALSLADMDSSIPEMLNVLIEIALLTAKEGNPEKAVEILALCRDHPGLAVDAKEKIEQMFGIIRGEMPSDLYEASLQRAGQRQLAEVVSELMPQAQ